MGWVGLGLVGLDWFGFGSVDLIRFNPVRFGSVRFDSFGVRLEFAAKSKEGGEWRNTRRSSSFKPQR